MAVQIIITNAGRAALVNAANTGTNPVAITQIGLTATGFTPNATLTSLTGEFKRLSTMSGAVVADDIIHLTVRDESSETYNVRSFGLYLADGTLFAVYGQAALLVQKSSQSIMLLAVDIKFADIAAASLTFGNTDFLMPPATKTAQGVVELATEAEAISGIDDARAVTPKDNKTAFNNWLNARFGDNAPSPLLKDILALSLVEDVRTALGLKNAALKNEGAGGGLNADLLDGHHADYFTNIIARLGFTPLNATAYTAADVLAKLLTVDGAGSGLDADLLDGQEASYFTNIIARLGFTPLNAATYTAADVLAKLLTVDGAGSGLDADRLNGQSASYYTNIIARLGFTPLNAATYTAADVMAKLLTMDGSGSGLDADTVDGVQASQFLQVAASSFGLNGYVAFTNGLKIQWGRLSVTTNSTATVTYPLAFTAYSSPVVTSVGEQSDTAQDNNAGVTTVTLTNFRIHTAQNGNSNCWWIAVGY